MNDNNIFRKGITSVVLFSYLKQEQEDKTFEETVECSSTFQRKSLIWFFRAVSFLLCENTGMM